MRINRVYIGKLEKEGKFIPGIWCGTRPEDVTITEERNILFPEEGKKLKHKETELLFDTVWLRDGDVAENYEEIEERNTPNDITNENLPSLDSGQ